MTTASAIKLSICIPTLNRAAYIGDALASIISQATPECEIVVLDGGSSDDTQRVVTDYARRFDRLSYVRQSSNQGFDRDCDDVVLRARGQYCMLMSDDDLLKPGAVKATLDALSRDPSLVVLNVEFRDFRMASVVQRRWLRLASDRRYRGGETDSVFAELGPRLLYLGGVVFPRELWLARDRRSFYGSLFVNVGVLFQAPLPGEAVLLAEPLVAYRTGNTHTFSPRVLELMWVAWPALIWSLAPAASAKRRVCKAEPWRNFGELLVYRGLGLYSLAEYKSWIYPRARSMSDGLIPILIAVLPGALVNPIVIGWFRITRRRFHGWREPELLLPNLRQSRFYFRHWLRGPRRSPTLPAT
jgi:abequosyltransferase